MQLMLLVHLTSLVRVLVVFLFLLIRQHAQAYLQIHLELQVTSRMRCRSTSGLGITTVQLHTGPRRPSYLDDFRGSSLIHQYRRGRKWSNDTC